MRQKGHTCHCVSGLNQISNKCKTKTSQRGWRDDRNGGEKLSNDTRHSALTCCPQNNRPNRNRSAKIVFWKGEIDKNAWSKQVDSQFWSEARALSLGERGRSRRSVFRPVRGAIRVGCRQRRGRGPRREIEGIKGRGREEENRMASAMRKWEERSEDAVAKRRRKNRNRKWRFSFLNLKLYKNRTNAWKGANYCAFDRKQHEQINKEFKIMQLSSTYREIKMGQLSLSNFSVSKYGHFMQY